MMTPKKLIKFLFPDFLREFFKELGKLEPSAKTCSVCQAAYNNTLAHFHPWLIRKGATLAMHALPTRDHLLSKVCVDVPKAVDGLPIAIDVIDQVYNRTENLYTVYDLHGLP